MAKKTINYEPQVLNLTLYAGDGVRFRLLASDPSGEPVNLTGTIIAQIRKNREAADPADAVFDIDLTDAADGIAVVSMTGAHTHDLVESLGGGAGISDGQTYKGVWDLQWSATGAQPMTLCQGEVECIPDVSH